MSDDKKAEDTNNELADELVAALEDQGWKLNFSDAEINSRVKMPGEWCGGWVSV